MPIVPSSWATSTENACRPEPIGRRVRSGAPRLRQVCWTRGISLSWAGTIRAIEVLPASFIRASGAVIVRYSEAVRVCCAPTAAAVVRSVSTYRRVSAWTAAVAIAVRRSICTSPADRSSWRSTAPTPSAMAQPATATSTLTATARDHGRPRLTLEQSDRVAYP